MIKKIKRNRGQRVSTIVDATHAGSSYFIPHGFSQYAHGIQLVLGPRNSCGFEATRINLIKNRVPTPFSVVHSAEHHEAPMLGYGST
jgi:hypothetical protein